ncbi:pentapeptide repeat-containing protein [Candidatus Babeliales bacterium]|nr:pentapeptide repeat-containing protein [Candidatus Babeliales bacterium]MCF7899244.1 pentapeptide repeat-containing protein [Candidatus Babeliales bacterium]
MDGVEETQTSQSSSGSKPGTDYSQNQMPPAQFAKNQTPSGGSFFSKFFNFFKKKSSASSMPQTTTTTTTTTDNTAPGSLQKNQRQSAAGNKRQRERGAGLEDVDDDEEPENSDRAHRARVEEDDFSNDPDFNLSPEEFKQKMSEELKTLVSEDNEGICKTLLRKYLRKKQEFFHRIAIRTDGQDYKEKIRAEFHEGKRDFSNRIMVGVNFAGLDLSEINLSGAILIGADLRGVNLNEANLNGADLSGANLAGANLAKINLKEANLTNAILDSAQNINDALFQKTIFFKTSLCNITFNSCDFTDSQFSKVSVSNTVFSNSNLTNALIQHIIPKNMTSKIIIFNNSNLKNLIIRTKFFRGFNFSGSSNVNEAYVLDLDAYESILAARLEDYEENKKFEYVRLDGADLSGKNFSDFNFKGVSLKKADLRLSKLINVNLEEANLTGAKLDGADFISVDLKGAKLTDLLGRKSKFIRTNFTESLIQNSDFSLSIFDRSIFFGLVKFSNESKKQVKNTKFKMCQFINLNFNKVFIKDNSNFQGSKFDNVVFYNCLLTNVSMKQIEAKHLTFEYSGLYNINFESAILENVDFFQKWRIFSFDASSMSILNNLFFHNAILNKCIFAVINEKKNDWDPAGELDFTNANLNDVIFCLFKFKNCKFAEASQLDSVIFKQIELENCDASKEFLLSRGLRIEGIFNPNLEILNQKDDRSYLRRLWSRACDYTSPEFLVDAAVGGVGRMLGAAIQAPVDIGSRYCSARLEKNIHLETYREQLKIDDEHAILRQEQAAQNQNSSNQSNQ